MNREVLETQARYSAEFCESRMGAEYTLEMLQAEVFERVTLLASRKRRSLPPFVTPRLDKNKNGQLQRRRS